MKGTYKDTRHLVSNGLQVTALSYYGTSNEKLWAGRRCLFRQRFFVKGKKSLMRPVCRMILLERKHPMKNDVLLQHDVVLQLEHQLLISEYAIGVEVHNGVVKLVGRVRDYATLVNAELVALHVEGVTTVILDVHVIGSRCGHPFTHSGIERDHLGQAAGAARNRTHEQLALDQLHDSQGP